MMISCEGCGEAVAESDAFLDQVPGATLAWCPDCAAPLYHEEVL